MQRDAFSPACNPGFLDTLTWDEPRAAALSKQALRDGRFARMPFILETPKGLDPSGRDLDEINIAAVRGLECL